MSLGCRDDVSVTSRCCFGGVMLTYPSCFRNGFADVSVMFQ